MMVITTDPRPVPPNIQIFHESLLTSLWGPVPNEGTEAQWGKEYGRPH